MPWAKDALVGVALDLEASLRHVHLTALELHVDDGHAVDEQHHVAAAVAQGLARLEAGLTYNLVAALPAEISVGSKILR
jgi:hypothetical protein